jgi:ankyrin repeat protein
MVVEWLLQDGRADPSAGNKSAIQEAAWNGHVEVVRLLLADKRVDLGSFGAVLEAVARRDTVAVLKLLKEGNVDPSALGVFLIRWASRDGHLEIVRVLLRDRRVDPTASNNKAIWWAARNGHAEIVQLLLKDGRADPAKGLLRVKSSKIRKMLEEAVEKRRRK